MDLKEAIVTLGIQGYPTTRKVLAAEAAISTTDPRREAKLAAARALREFVKTLGSPEITAAAQDLAWAPGSPTEFQAYAACERAYDEAQEREAERRLTLVAAGAAPRRP